MNMFPVGAYTFSGKTNPTHHLEWITVGYSWAYLPLSEQEMVYFSWVDPVPAREVANHMKLVCLRTAICTGEREDGPQGGTQQHLV